MPDLWPVTIRTPDGDFVEVDTLPATGRVYIGTSSAGVLLSAAQREEFSRAYIAASWAAEGRVTSDG
jgi:hypothetical protein